MVNDLKELDRYPWTGHGAILGKRKNPLIPASAATNKREKPKKSLAEKTIEDVLLHFGNKLMEARRRYRQFACAACSVAPEDGMGPALLNLFHLFNRGEI